MESLQEANSGMMAWRFRW